MLDLGEVVVHTLNGTAVAVGRTIIVPPVRTEWGAPAELPPAT